jgi:choline dehydrogenase-like flavoprotein
MDLTNRSEYRLVTQVLVIGSGAGGAITAATLAEAGYSVLIVEEGPDVEVRNLATHTPQAMQLLYRNGGLSPILGNPNIAFVEGCCVGGSTEINSAFWLRTPPDAIHRWQEIYRVHDLSLEGLDLLFKEIETELGISFLNSDKLPPSSARFKYGAEKLGWMIEEIPRAQATNLEGSAYAPDAKRSMSRTYIPRALRAGARLLPNCQITRLHHRRGRVSRASGVLKRPTVERILSGRPMAYSASKVQIEAEVIFVCGGAIQTPVLLRSSGIKRNIGNNLRIHPMLKVAALFDEPLDSHDTTLPIYQIKEFWPEITLGGSVFTPGFLALTLSEDWIKNQEVMRNWRQMALYYAACRSSNQGTVRAFPLTHEAIVRYKLSRQDQRNLSIGLARLGEALFAGGARKLYPALRAPSVLNSIAECRALLERPIPLSSMGLTTVHAFSTCPMGENEALCATDSFGRVHGFENLYIADASLIPDSPGVNPQGTIMALALRNARHFLEGNGGR